MPLKWTSLPSRQLVKFFDPANPSTSYTPQNNPEQIVLKPNSVRKYVETTNGTSIILGDREYPPKEIALTWTMLDAADLEGIRPFIYTAPIVYVDNNDQGYLGVLVLDEVEQLPAKTFLVYTVKASFLVLAPYNGQQTTLNQLVAPTIVGGGVTTGYIPNATTVYFWTTVFTPYGESTVSPVYTFTSNAAKQAAILTFTAPSSSWYRKTRIYWNSTNSPSTATLLTEVLAGQTTSFTAYSPYFGYSSVNPPPYGTAFTGYFAGGRWTPQ